MASLQTPSKSAVLHCTLLVALVLICVLGAKSSPVLALFLLFVTVGLAYLLGRQSDGFTDVLTELPQLQEDLHTLLHALHPTPAHDSAAKDALHFITEVRELISHYYLITTNLAAAVVIYDNKRRVRFCSPYTEVLTGYSVEEIMLSETDLLASLVVEDDREHYERARAVSELGEDYHVQYQSRHKTGLKLWFDTRLVPVCDSTGAVTSMMCLTVDVTESVNSKRQIQEQNQDLSDFSYMISHDLKAPIFTIKGMAVALKEDFGASLGEDGQELLRFILDGADRLEALVSSVIEYSALSTKETRESIVALNSVLDSVQQDFNEQIRITGAKITVEPGLPKVRGDQLRYYQVFSNLIGNALKYRDQSRAPEITVRARPGRADLAVIEITDNGLGIPEGKLKDIFRPYQRAHGNDIEGSGIGLACVKKIVEKFGGTVTAKSNEGTGSTFIVSLPLPPPSPQEIPAHLTRYYSEETHGS